MYSGNERSQSFSEKSLDRNLERLGGVNNAGAARFQGRVASGNLKLVKPYLGMSKRVNYEMTSPYLQARLQRLRPAPNPDEVGAF